MWSDISQFLCAFPWWLRMLGIFFIYLLTISISFLEKCLFRCSIVLKLDCHFVELYEFWILSLVKYIICKYLSHSMTCLFTFFMMSFETQVFLTLMKSNFIDHAFHVIGWKLLPSQKHENLLMFSFRFYKFMSYIFLWSILCSFLYMVWGRNPPSLFYMWISIRPNNDC